MLTMSHHGSWLKFKHNQHLQSKDFFDGFWVRHSGRQGYSRPLPQLNHPGIISGGYGDCLQEVKN